MNPGTTIIYATFLEDRLPGPSFLPIVFVAALVGPLFYAELRGYYHLSRLLGLGLISLATIENAGRGLSYLCDRGSPTSTSFHVIHVVSV